MPGCTHVYGAQSLNILRSVYLHAATHVVSPADFVNPRIGLNVALEVNIHSLPNCAGIELASELEGDQRDICNKMHDAVIMCRKLSRLNRH